MYCKSMTNYKILNKYPDIIDCYDSRQAPVTKHKRCSLVCWPIEYNSQNHCLHKPSFKTCFNLKILNTYSTVRQGCNDLSLPMSFYWLLYCIVQLNKLTNELLSYSNSQQNARGSFKHQRQLCLLTAWFNITASIFAFLFFPSRVTGVAIYSEKSTWIIST